MTKTELLEQITAIATTVNQTKYIGGVEHGGLILILNDLVKEYHQRFVNEQAISNHFKNLLRAGRLYYLTN